MSVSQPSTATSTSMAAAAISHIALHSRWWAVSGRPGFIVAGVVKGILPNAHAWIAPGASLPVLPSVVAALACARRRRAKQALRDSAQAGTSANTERLCRNAAAPLQGHKSPEQLTTMYPPHGARIARRRSRSCFSISMMANNAMPTPTMSSPSRNGTASVANTACSGGR